MYIDTSVYPDLDEPPRILAKTEAKADYVDRICAAWDFHVHPEPETFDLLRGWQDVFDQFPLLLSPGYHAFRAWFDWPPIPVPKNLSGPEPLYRELDRREGRVADPCEGMI